MKIEVNNKHLKEECKVASILSFLCVYLISMIISWQTSVEWAVHGVLLGAAIVSFFCLLPDRWYLPLVFYYVSAFVIGFGLCADTLCFYFIHEHMNVDVVCVIFANLDEWRNFVSDYNINVVKIICSILLVLLILIMAVFMPFFMRRHCRKKVSQKTSFRIVLAVAVFFVLDYSFYYLHKYNLNGYFGKLIYSNRSFSPYTSMLFFYKREKKYIECNMKEKKVLQLYPSECREAKGMVGVVLIGESSTRTHHSSFGYERDTNAFTDKFKGDVIFYPKAFSFSPYTMEAVKAAIFLKENWNNVPRFSIVSLLKRHYQICYVDNNWVSASFKKLLGFPRVAELHKDDIEIVEWLKNELKKETNDNKLYFLHLRGSHFPFDMNIPGDEWKHYSGTTLRKDAYDNSIRYTDYVISQIIELAKKKNISVNFQFFYP